MIAPSNVQSPANVQPPDEVPGPGLTEAALLLAWYDRHARRMPWRVPPEERKLGVRPEPYHVWLSEVMLQQTQVQTVHAYFQDFLTRWPTLRELALCDADDIMKAWAGLGYYSRARNLKRCAEVVWHEHGGRFPDSSAALRELPGIGAYTSAAIAAIAFDERVAVVDGNVERVVARLCRIDRPVSEAKPQIRTLVDAMTPADRPGDFAQAMMDLGATLCTPRNPACVICPLTMRCGAAANGSQADYPVRTEKASRPLRRGAAFIAQDRLGHVLLRKRGPTGMLAGMSEPPTTAWSARADGATGADSAPFAASWQHRGAVSHSFTHFDLSLEIWHAGAVDADFDGFWVAPGDLDAQALPTLMKKAIALAVPHAFASSRKAPSARRSGRGKARDPGEETP